MSKVLQQFDIIFIPQSEGGFTIEVPALPGCITEAETLEEGKEKAEEAIELYLEALEIRGIPLPQTPKESVTMTISVSVETKDSVYA